MLVIIGEISLRKSFESIMHIIFSSLNWGMHKLFLSSYLVSRDQVSKIPLANDFESIMGIPKCFYTCAD